MSDLISRADAIEAVQDVDTRELISCDEVVKALKALPSADAVTMNNIQQLEAENGALKEMIKFYRGELDGAVSVVRCKDCRWWQDNNGGYPHANCHWCETETPDADDFCSLGERREP